MQNGKTTGLKKRPESSKTIMKQLWANSGIQDRKDEEVKR